MLTTKCFRICSASTAPGKVEGTSLTPASHPRCALARLTKSSGSKLAMSSCCSTRQRATPERCWPALKPPNNHFKAPRKLGRGRGRGREAFPPLASHPPCFTSCSAPHSTQLGAGVQLLTATSQSIAAGRANECPLPPTQPPQLCLCCHRPPSPLLCPAAPSAADCT